MIDVYLYSDTAGLQIEIADSGLVSLTRGVQSAIVLSLAGGNEEDLNIPATDRKQWWGNLTLPEPSRLRGETLAMLRRGPVHSGNLSKLIQAAERDIEWLVAAGHLADAVVAATIQAQRRVQLIISTPEGAVRVSMRFAG